MGSQHTPLAALSLLGVLATSCLGGVSAGDAGWQVKLNSSVPCQGQLSVLRDSTWFTVDSRSWVQHSDLQQYLKEASELCQRVGCRKALALVHFPPASSPHQLTCRGPVSNFENCTNSSTQTSTLGLICSEPPKKTPPPTSPPPTTTAAPTAPPRLRLAGPPGGLRCAGVLEVHMGGLSGSVSAPLDGAPHLEDRVCQSLQCGSFVKHLREPARMPTPEASGHLPIRWALANANCSFPEDCFLRAQRPTHGPPLALLCSRFQPKVQSRLVGGISPCTGTVEVRQDGPWAALCGSVAQPRERWAEVCQEQRCGQLSSYRVLDASNTARGQRCPEQRLSQCHLLEEEKGRCRRVLVTCQDPNAPGLGAGSVMSIILALVLLAVLLAVCGPLAYKKLVKKFRQKKQRQWIGPTEMSQNMSFHRNHTATVRPAENPAAPRVENEYSQPPSSARTSYPALEGALHRISAQPDNSSDSDYDLHVTQRL